MTTIEVNINRGDPPRDQPEGEPVPYNPDEHWEHEGDVEPWEIVPELPEPSSEQQ